MDKIKLHLGNNLRKVFGEDAIEIIDTGNIGVYDYPTLKDVATMLYCFMGQGVTWNLIEEIATRLELPFDKVEKVIGDIIKEYYEMSHDEAKKKDENTLNFYVKFHKPAEPLTKE